MVALNNDRLLSLPMIMQWAEDWHGGGGWRRRKARSSSNFPRFGAVSFPRSGSIFLSVGPPPSQHTLVLVNAAEKPGSGGSETRKEANDRSGPETDDEARDKVTGGRRREWW